MDENGDSECVVTNLLHDRTVSHARLHRSLGNRSACDLEFGYWRFEISFLVGCIKVDLVILGVLGCYLALKFSLCLFSCFVSIKNVCFVTTIFFVFCFCFEKFLTLTNKWFFFLELNMHT